MTRRDAAWALALVALVAVAYLPAFSSGYVWDDDAHVTASPALSDLRGLVAIWTTLDATPQYYPLTHTTFWIERRLWGLDPAGYHAVNVALHAGAALALWRLLVLLGVPGAWLASAVFALHPVHVESVAWITERKNTLSAFLYLASARVFLGWALTGHRGRRAPGWAAALYAAALLAKTVTSTLPLGLAIVLWWKRGRLERKEIAWLAPMLAAGALLGVLTRHLERALIGADPLIAIAPWERLALAGRNAWFYLGKLAWPTELSFVYPRGGVDASSAAAWVGAALLAALVVALWAARGRAGRGPLAALAYFGVTLAPALGFFDVYPFRYAWVADHFVYLASLGPIVLASAAAASLPLPRALRPIAAAAVVALLGAATLDRCRAFADEETLWRDTLRRNPGAWLAHNNLGILLAERGSTEDAASHFERALALYPGHSGARANLGYLQERMGRDAEAAATLEAAAAARPEDADVRVHLVRTLLRLGRPRDALPRAIEAARLAPDDPEILCDAGSLLAQAGRIDEGIAYLRRALALRPDFARARVNLERAQRRAPGSDVEYPPVP